MRARRIGFIGAALVAAWLSGAAAIAAAGPVSAGNITLDKAWARPTYGSSGQSVAYLQITNGGDKADELTAVSTAQAGSAEIHTTSMGGDMMQMRAVSALTIPSHSTVTLAPNGTHIMLMDVKAPLHAGDMVALTLTFRAAGEIAIDAPVRDTAP